MKDSRTRRTVAVLAAGAVMAFASPAMAAPQTFNTALPVAKGEILFREQVIDRKASDDPSTADRDLNVLRFNTVLAYGVTPRFALFGALPYLDKRLELTSSSGARIARSTRGLGDVRLFGRYTLFQKNMQGSNLRIAPFLGLELPTGDDDASDSFGKLPATLQLGSGSWDLFGGVVATWQTLDYQVDSQLSYKDNTEANGFEFGDELRFDTSLQFRLWPRKFGSGVPGFLYGGLELNLLHQAKNRSGGVDDPNSGGTSLFLSPGLQYVTRRWVVEAIVQLPVVQDLNGTALKDDYVLRGGIRANF